MVDRAPDPDDPVEAAVADFAEQLFGGKQPDPDAFCAAHPAFAPVLRDRLERLIEIASRFERPAGDVAAASDEQHAIAGAACMPPGVDIQALETPRLPAFIVGSTAGTRCAS